jgi:membrane associated rhomboid family serine protease
MFVLHSFGSGLLQILGARRFLGLYLLSGIGSSIGSMMYKTKAYEKYRYVSPSLGASGCVSGLLSCFAAMYPFATVQLIFIPMPAWAAIGGFACYDLYKATKSTQGQIDSAGHIGGGLTGLIWYLLFK